MIFILKFIKFCVVGFSGLLVDFSLTYLLKEKLSVNKFLANSIGFMMAASTNYVLNRIWTFESDNPEILSEYSSFLSIALIGLFINNLLLFLLLKKYKFYLAKFIAIVLTTIWNFGANYILTFN